jgi:hypothetical protein
MAANAPNKPEVYVTVTDKMERLDGGPDAYQCGNCEQVWTFAQLKDIKDLSVRIWCGESVPAGECPECEALAHPVSAGDLEGLQAAWGITVDSEAVP